MNLFKHQIDFLNTRVNKSSLIHSCGLGKSRTALEWTKQGDTSILIICPKALRINWQREANKWGVLTAVVVTKEEFRKSVSFLQKYNQVIVDEVHNSFLTPHFKSQTSRALKNYLKKYDIKRVLLLTATPFCSSPWNIYNLAILTGHNWNWKTFDYTFFDHIWMGRRQVPVAKKGIEKRLAEAVKKIADVVDIKDVMDVPLQNHCQPEYFQLSTKQREAIKGAYDPLPIVRFTHQHEIEQGILIGNEFKRGEFFGCDKNERILTLVEENPKVAIVCRYNAQIDALNGLLNAYSPLIIRGDVKNRDEVCLEAEKREKAVVLIQADCGLGFQLPSLELCIFASQSYSYTSWVQMCGRFLRMDKPSRTTFMYLLAEGDSVDQAIFDAVGRKEDFDIALS